MGAELHLKSTYLLVTMLCTIAMQFIYPIFIKRIDVVTGIRVVQCYASRYLASSVPF